MIFTDIMKEKISMYLLKIMNILIALFSVLWNLHFMEKQIEKTTRSPATTAPPVAIPVGMALLGAIKKQRTN